MADKNWYYEKLDENMEIKRCPQDDKEGKETGKFILNLPAYFDENPEERKRLGWIKHITHEPNEVIVYNRQSEYVVKSTKQVDEWTVEDIFHVLPKSEEQLLFEEMLAIASWGDGAITFY